MDDDRSLVEAVIARKPRAFETFVSRHQRLVWHLVYRMVHHEQDTEELAQDVFMRAYRYLPDFRFESALSTWLGQIAFSVAGRHLRKKRIATVDLHDESGADRLAETVTDDFDLEHAVISFELGGQVHEALEKLAPLQRTLVSLYYLEEMSVAEIAAMAGIPEGTAKSYLFRARAQLRRHLQSDAENAA